ncbi:hypothetical protein F4780DRAFT_719278 [Xylariomycetidae sp. FL0641]|nr:hypothetical protein F4780DRAFT_719278 [Xylariomycetidae sp. FL0641]
MNNTTHAPYTPLESLLLFQLLNKYGFVNGSFNRISDELKNTPLVYEQDNYNAARLSPDALQHLALQLVREEQKRDADAVAEKTTNGLSPESKKRKLPSPPLPSLKEAHEQPEKLPILVDRLYARFRDHLVRAIREDERRYEAAQRDIAAIERGEWDGRIAQEKRSVHPEIRTPAAIDSRPARPTGQAGPVQSPVPTPTPLVAPKPQAPARRPESSPAWSPVPTPALGNETNQERRKTHTGPLPVPAPPRSPGEVRQVALERRQQDSGRPAAGVSPVLQHPQAVQGYSSRPPSTTPQPQPSSTDGLQRPEIGHKGKVQTPAPASVSVPISASPVQPHAQAHAQAHAQSHNQPHHQPPAQSQPLPQPHPQSYAQPHPQSHAQPHSSPHHPPHPQPQNQAHSQIHPQSHPSPHSPHQNAQAKGKATPKSQPQFGWRQYQPPNQPLQQTPVPSPLPPYGAGNTRPPSYSPQSPAGHPQPPQRHAEYPMSRQMPPKNATLPRHPSQGSGLSSPSVLVPPQTSVGQIPPSLQSLPVNATPDGAGQPIQQRKQSSVSTAASPGPMASSATYSPHHVPGQLPAQTPVRPPAALAAHSASTSTRPTGTSATQAAPRPPPTTSGPSPHPPALTVGNPGMPPTPATAASSTVQQRHAQSFPRPYSQQGEPMATSESTQRPHSLAQTPLARPQTSRTPPVPRPQTSLALHVPSHRTTGAGTKWVSTPTPSTPRLEEANGYFDVAKSIEPISPPPRPAQLPKSTPDKQGKKDLAKPSHKIESSVSKNKARPPRVVPKPATTVQTGERMTPSEPVASAVKNEAESTPRALEEFDDVAADEHLLGRTHPSTGSLLSHKRKRQESPMKQAPPSPATHVLWTRGFNKISMTALDQIIGHRYANMFANPIKSKAAPGYYETVLRPQDLKGIQKAITAGSKAAAATVATMSDVDANAPAVWLPISIDLVPPRGIINIAQLERELVHMFANAIMYNPDPQRGFGPSFMRRYQSTSDGDTEDTRGYEFDENGVVKDTRNMFSEVEKLLGDLRNEVVPRAHAAAGGGSRSMSAAVGEMSTAEDDGDEQGGDAKRRRVRG